MIEGRFGRLSYRQAIALQPHGFVPLPAGPDAPGAGLFGLVGPDRLVGFRPKLPVEEPPIFESGSLIVPVEGGVFGTGLVA